jgi:hypothetical protein
MPILVLLSSVAVLIGTGIFAIGLARSPRATPIVYGLCLAACGEGRRRGGCARPRPQSHRHRTSATAFRKAIRTRRLSEAQR